MYEGRTNEWEGLRILQEKMKVENRFVFVDRGYRPETVALECSRAATKDDTATWNCLLGEESNGYAIKVNNKQVTRPFSTIKRARTTKGLRWRYVKFSNLLAKDTLAALMRGEGAGWHIGSDYSAEYKKQIQNEKKVEISPGRWRYVVKKKWVGNHLWDCETMQIVAASIYGVFNTEEEV